VSEWVGGLAFSDTPVTGEQAEQLVQALMDTAGQPERGKVGEFDWDKVTARASAWLSPPQMAALRERRAHHDWWEKASQRKPDQNGGAAK